MTWTIAPWSLYLYKIHRLCFLITNCLSAIRFRGGVILQVSCYTLLMRIPTSMATVLLSAPHGTPFRFIGRLEQTTLGPAYLESVRLNPSSPVLLTRNGPLGICSIRNGVSHCGKPKFSKRWHMNAPPPERRKRWANRFLTSVLPPSPSPQSSNLDFWPI